MIKIKKGLWIVCGILLIIAIAFGFTTIKKNLAMKQLKEIPIQEEIKEQKDHKEDKTDHETDETANVPDDPVKDFLSEKAKNTMKLFFTNDIKIVAIGDSLTEGIGDETDSGGYVGILSDTINAEQPLAEISNFGKRGNRTDQLLTRLQDPEIEAAINKADIILITIGANDIMQIFKENFTDLTLDKFTTGEMNYELRLRDIFSTMKEQNPNAEIYLIGFYNPFKKYFADLEELEIIVEGWNRIGEQVTDEYDNVSFIPIKDLFENTTINYLSEDHFHPNHLGYEVMAERILQYITNEEEGDEEAD